MVPRIFQGSLLIAALALAACQDAGPTAPLATPSISAAVQPVQLPYKARFSGTTQFAFPPNACPAAFPILVTETGVGNAAHLGRSEVVFTMCGRLVAGPGSDHEYGPGPSRGVATAADGDELWFTTEDGTFTAATGAIRAHAVIVGGTGRFADATGEMENVGFGGMAGWVIEGSGWISY